MQKHKFLHILVVLFFTIPTLVNAQQETDKIGNLNHLSVPGTSIKMDIPDVFAWNADQNAYIYTGAASSISFREIKGTSGSGVAKAMEETLKKDATLQTNTKSTVKTKAGVSATQFVTTFSVSTAGQDKKTEFERVIFICGNDANAVWVSVTYPTVTRSLLAEVLHNCLLTIEF